MKKLSKNRGITLVSLVITIIVLLILAGVTISLVVGNNGIIQKAQEAKQNMTSAAEEEKDWLGELESEIDAANEVAMTNGNWNAAKRVNSPKLEGTGLKGITIGEDGNITEIGEEQTNWYSYTENDRRWANAKTADGSMWVWIPRYAYKITYDNPNNKSQGGTIDIVFLQNDTNLDKNGNDVTQTTYQDEQGNIGAYIVHPAFKNGTSNGFANGEWDDEIPGFWVAKFEAGYAEGNNSVNKVDSGLKYGENSATKNFYGTITANTTAMYYPVFLPKTYSYNYITIGDAYTLSKNLNKEGNPYGLVSTKTDTHMMKNSEWGAVAYLSHSEYGRNKEEITRNNVNLRGTTSRVDAVTGMAGESVSAGENKTTIDEVNDGTSGSYSWETANGQKASTTGNVYGIYDMSGGAWERTAGYINNGHANLMNYGNNLVNEGGAGTSTKYKSVYAYNTGNDESVANYNQSPNPSRVGETIWEISTNGTGATGWNKDYSTFASTDCPFFVRGGGNMGGTVATGTNYFGRERWRCQQWRCVPYCACGTVAFE